MRTGFRTKKGSLKWKGFLTRTGFLTGKDSLYALIDVIE